MPAFRVVPLATRVAIIGCNTRIQAHSPLVALLFAECAIRTAPSNTCLWGTRCWLDEKYKGWQGRIGLEPKVDSEGQVEWLPP